MDEELTSALRRVLEEDVLPDLRALSAGLDRISCQLDMGLGALEAKVDTMLVELKAMREEMQAMREEMRVLREQTGSSNPQSFLIH